MVCRAAQAILQSLVRHRAGRLLQIGVEEGQERDVIVHAMPAQDKNLR